MTRRISPRNAFAFLALAAAALSACAQTVVLEDQTGDGGTKDGSSTDGHCFGGQSPPPLPFTQEIPKVVVALDRSSAMLVPFGGDPSQLSSAVDALSAQVSAQVHDNQTNVRFAFLDFPDIANDCNSAVGCCSSDVTPTTSADALQMAAYATCNPPPNSCTTETQRPTAYALSKAQAFLGNQPQTGKGYVLLVSDGPPGGCSGSGMSSHDCSDAITEIETLNNLGIQTTIVSIGDAPTTGCLLDLASTAGGDGAPFYYTASSPTALTTVLTTITNAVAQDSCHLDLTTPPNSPDQLSVSFQGTAVPRDTSHNNGWDMNGNGGARITLYGPACNELMQNGASSFAISDGCSGGHFSQPP